MESKMYNQCLRKRPYYDYELAERVANRRKDSGVKLYIYKCPYCKHYHLTKMKSWGMRKNFDKIGELLKGLKR